MKQATGTSAKNPYRLYPALRWLAATCMLACLGIVAGCDRSPSPAEQSSQAITSTPDVAQASPEREVIDMAKRTVKLRQDINRVCTLGSVPMMNTFIESLGAGKKIYNQPSKFHDIHGAWKMHLQFAPQIAEGPHFQSASHELLIENILAADPDVCVTNSRVILEALDKLGIPVVFVDWSTVDQMMESVIMMGEVLHEQSRATAYVDYFNNMKQQLQALSDTIPESERLSVLYGIRMLFSIASGSLTEEWLATIGADSVTSEAYKAGRREYDREELLQWNPDVIFITSPKTIEELNTDPAYKDLRAVQNGAIVLAPTVGHMWGGHTVEAPIAACWMMHKLYPELMPLDRLTEEIRYFYKTFFSYEMNDQQITAIIAGESAALASTPKP